MNVPFTHGKRSRRIHNKLTIMVIFQEGYSISLGERGDWSKTLTFYIFQVCIACIFTMRLISYIEFTHLKNNIQVLNKQWENKLKIFFKWKIYISWFFRNVFLDDNNGYMDKIIFTTYNRKPQIIQTWAIMKIFFSHNKEGCVAPKSIISLASRGCQGPGSFRLFNLSSSACLAICPHSDSPHRWPQQFLGHI